MKSSLAACEAEEESDDDDNSHGDRNPLQKILKGLCGHKGKSNSHALPDLFSLPTCVEVELPREYTKLMRGGLAGGRGGRGGKGRRRGGRGEGQRSEGGRGGRGGRRGGRRGGDGDSETDTPNADQTSRRGRWNRRRGNN